MPGSPAPGPQFSFSPSPLLLFSPSFLLALGDPLAFTSTCCFQPVIPVRPAMGSFWSLSKHARYQRFLIALSAGEQGEANLFIQASVCCGEDRMVLGNSRQRGRRDRKCLVRGVPAIVRVTTCSCVCNRWSGSHQSLPGWLVKSKAMF